MAMNDHARQLSARFDRLAEMGAELQQTAADEERSLTDVEQRTLNGWRAECDAIIPELEVAAAFDKSVGAHDALRGAFTPTGNGHRRPQQLETRGWGDTFVDADQFRSWHGGRGAPVDMPSGLFDLEQRQAAGPIMTGDLPHIEPSIHEPRLPTYRFPLVGAVGRERVTSGSVEYVVQVPTFASSAPVVPEGQLKPRAEIEFEVKSAVLDTYAWHRDITRQALEDYPRIRSIIETFLRQGLMRAVEDAVANAIAAATDIPTIGAATDPLSASIRVGMAQVEINGFTPNAVLLNPGDAAGMDLATAILAASVPGVLRGFWGLLAVTSTRIPAGTAYVGDLGAGVTLFERSPASVYLSDSHADIFLRNVLVILAETRALAAVTAPTAMAKCTGNGRLCLECGDGGVPMPNLPASLGQSAQAQGDQQAGGGGPETTQRRRS